jgi:hypothetical protein
VSDETAEAKVERLITEIEEAGAKLAAVQAEANHLRAELMRMIVELAAAGFQAGYEKK